ncbi:hypothetical protein IP88_10100 [alpha proteobacterium AAP81b]|nr:hypothetical protein IP88_10100 [alpha proteobacterium AAP81b]
MTTPPISQAMIALYDRFTHGTGLSRRDMMAELARLAGGTAAATALLPLIAGSASAAGLTSPGDGRVEVSNMRYQGNGAALSGYMAAPVEGASRAPKILVIHENRGLNDHIRDVTRRLALAGFIALAPDLLARHGETPRTGMNGETAEDIARKMIAALDRPTAVGDALAALTFLNDWEQGRNARPGAVGFCWGGGMVNDLAVAAGNRLRAGTAYYGPAPSDLSGAAKVKARMQFHFAGLDDRINATAPAWLAALEAAGVKVESWKYEKVNHAFNNDTSEARYDRAAAQLAWERTLAWQKG